MVDPPDAAWRYAAPAERNYAAAELHAFTLAWLCGLDRPVRNHPDPGCLAGRLPSHVVVAHAAARAGLVCGPLNIGTDGPDDLLTAAVRASAGPLRPVHLPVLDGEVETSVDVPGGVREGVRMLVKELAEGPCTLDSWATVSKQLVDQGLAAEEAATEAVVEHAVEGVSRDHPRQLEDHSSGCGDWYAA